MGSVFQIKNSQGVALPINELDKEAASFWGKEVHVKDYATPLVVDESKLSLAEALKAHMSNTNWYDMIGWMIAYNKLESWDQVREHLLSPFSSLLNEGMSTDELYDALPQVKKYIDLVEHWQGLGYVPHGYEE